MILITGASSGIGEACAEIFAESKRDLILIARRKDRLERLARRLSTVRCQTFELDVSDREAVLAFARSQASLLGQVEVLVNNAGLARGFDAFQSANLDDWDEMIGTNLNGLLYLTREIVPRMVEKKRGHIVNLGSVAGRWIYPKGHVYCATKRAVSALTEGLRLDLLGTGVRVSEISPGMVETEFSLVRFRDEKKAEAVYAGMQPLTARDVAETIAWCVNRPAHVNVQEIILYPTAQASPTTVARS
jgi:NADP-dependent 3-hydroxy acid dehydrogenase YdfG